MTEATELYDGRVRTSEYRGGGRRRGLESQVIAARGWVSQVDWRRQVLGLAIVSILYIYLTGFFIGTTVMRMGPGLGEGVPDSVLPIASSVSAMFVRWDAGYYLSIAERGYTAGGDERAFFPLYPVTVRIVSDIFGLGILWSGALVSGLAFIASGFVLYLWMKCDYSHGQALLATTLLFFSPMAFFFVAFYGEPLLLLTSTSALLFMRRGRFVESGIAIALAGAARPTAFLLAVPYAVEFWQQRDFSRRRCIEFVLGGMLAPAGTVAYSLFLFLQTGQLPLAGGGTWKTYYTWPWLVFYDGLQAALVGTEINQDWFSRALVWHDLLYACLALALSVWALSRLRLSTALLLLLGTLFLCSVHGPEGYAFWSISRRVAALVPVYMAAALLLSEQARHWRALSVGASTVFLGILSAWFVSGRWIA
jgi:hypothetical protein